MAFPADWTYYKIHTINGSTAGAQTNYQLRFVLYLGTGTDSGNTVYLENHANSDFSDVRFSNADASAELDHALIYRDSTKAIFYVEVPGIPADPDTVDIRVYYGNAGATSASNWSNTFLYSDDFNRDVNEYLYSNIFGGSSGDFYWGTADWSNIAYDAVNDCLYWITIENPGNYLGRVYKYSIKNRRIEQWASVGDLKAADHHNISQLAVDSAGILWVFYGAHNAQVYYKKTTASGDLTTLSGETAVTGATDGTYHQAFFDSNGKLWLIYRGAGSAGTQDGIILQTWTSGGGWSSRVQIADFNNTAHRLYLRAVIAPDNTIYLMWTNRTGGTSDPAEWIDVYFAKHVSGDVDGVWKKMDGTSYAMPISSAAAEQIYAGTKTKQVDVRADSNSNPYVCWVNETGVTRFQEADAKIAYWNGTAWVTVAITSTSDITAFSDLWINFNDSNKIYFWAVRTILGIAEAGYYTSSDLGASWSAWTAITTSSAVNNNAMMGCNDGNCPIPIVCWSKGLKAAFHVVGEPSTAETWTVPASATEEVFIGSNLDGKFTRVDTEDHRARAAYTFPSTWKIESPIFINGNFDYGGLGGYYGLQEFGAYENNENAKNANNSVGILMYGGGASLNLTMRARVRNAGANTDSALQSLSELTTYFTQIKRGSSALKVDLAANDPTIGTPTTLTASQSDAVTLANLQVSSQNSQTASERKDDTLWIRYLYLVVSNYADPEPSNGTWSAEQSETGVTVSLSGTSGTGQAGNINSIGAALLTLAGASASGQAGTITVTTTSGATITLSGVSGTGDAGLLSATGAALLTTTGAQGTGQSGTLSATGGAILNLSGTQGTGQTGSVTSLGGALSGLTGVSSTGQAGTVTIQVAGGVSITLSGTQSTGQAGTLTTITGASFALSGVASTGQAGTLTVATVEGASVTLTGVQAAGGAGDLSLLTGATVSLSGTFGTGQTGTVTVTVPGTITIDLTFKTALILSAEDTSLTLQ